MSRYRMDDGTVVDTDRATGTWDGSSRWDGSNNIDVHTGSQWRDATLYCSCRGRYYLVVSSRVQGETDSVDWVQREGAARWLVLHGYLLPADLADLEDASVE